MAEIVNGVYGADAVKANYVQIWFRLFRSVDVKYAPHTGRPIIENVDRITEIIEVDRLVNSLSITQELKIDYKTVLNHLRKELWFQQDGATCHTARVTIDLLKDTFGDRLISRFGPVNWPPRSCDLTPLDYFLWGYVKLLVYADNPQTLDHLEDNIRRVIADIRPQMLEKVIENWTSRLDYIRASRGSHMPEIIFKISVRKEVNWETLIRKVSTWQFYRKENLK
ncbi:putative DD41D transposase [Trichonephila clavipes]|nr:putative DD41D transposase [Trichonephila clavipes]